MLLNLFLGLMASVCALGNINYQTQPKMQQGDEITIEWYFTELENTQDFVEIDLREQLENNEVPLNYYIKSAYLSTSMGVYLTGNDYYQNEGFDISRCSGYSFNYYMDLYGVPGLEWFSRNYVIDNYDAYRNNQFNYVDMTRVEYLTLSKTTDNLADYNKQYIVVNDIMDSSIELEFSNFGGMAISDYQYGGVIDGWEVNYCDMFLAITFSSLPPVTEYSIGYDSGIDNGYSLGYQEGFREGFDTGYVQGGAERYEAGYEEGYQIGFDAGEKYAEEITLNNQLGLNTKAIFEMILDCTTKITGIEVFPGVSIATIIFFPLAMALIFVIIKMFRGS